MSNQNTELNSFTAISKVLLIFYLINLKGDKSLIGTPFKRFIDENRLAQHFISFITIVILFTLYYDISGKKTVSLLEIFFYAFVTYALFIMSTKIDAHWNIMFLLILAFGFFMDYNIRSRESEIMSDPNIQDTMKNNILEQNNRYINYYAGLVMFFIITGTVLYSERKAEQYGGSYDPVKFFIY